MLASVRPLPALTLLALSACGARTSLESGRSIGDAAALPVSVASYKVLITDNGPLREWRSKTSEISELATSYVTLNVRSFYTYDGAFIATGHSNGEIAILTADGVVSRVQQAYDLMAMRSDAERVIVAGNDGCPETLNADGTHNTIDCDTTGTVVTYSPDGKTLLWMHEGITSGQLETSLDDGSSRRFIASCVGNCERMGGSFSFDATTLAMTICTDTYDPLGCGLSTIRLDSLEMHPVMLDQRAWPGQFGFTPDGKGIVFTTLNVSAQPQTWSLDVVDIASGVVSTLIADLGIRPPTGISVALDP